MLELSKGKQLAGRFVLESRLGGDSSAQVWRARDRLTATTVALKIVPAGGASAEQLRNEWQFCIRLMHPHIVRAFEFHEDDDVAFFSQQYLDGPSLGDLAGDLAVLAPFGLLVQALQYLHARDIVHRDIKAGNVLLDRNGAPYLCDFGVAARRGETASGGSPIAQSPQSLAGEEAKPADDIFALGTLMYELLTGTPPWSSASLSEDIRQRAPAAMQMPGGTAVPAELQQLTMAMLDKNAVRRPDAAQIGQTLDAAGFPAGLAQVEGLSKTARAQDEVIESVAAVRSSATSAAKQIVPDSGGISQQTMGIALGALLLILLGVVFLLPERVADTPDGLAVEQPAATAADPLSDAGEAPADVAEGGTPRARSRVDLPTQTLDGDDGITFNENTADYSGLDAEGRDRFAAEQSLGELLSALGILEARAVERWAPVEYRNARTLYADGDKAYLEKEFSRANGLYLSALDQIDPLYARIEPTFDAALQAAQAAFEAGDRLTALEQFELAVTITPNHPEASAGLTRARNLETVRSLMEQGEEYEEDLDLVAAQSSYAQAAALDPLWEPAQTALARIEKIRTEMEFDQRMTEGFDAISTGDYLGARAAFRMAERLIPDSPEPRDGLLQVDQGLRLESIQVLEQEALALQEDEHWDAVIKTYDEILKIDSSLAFAIDGLAHAREMAGLHAQLDNYIADPDRLAIPSVMQKATTLLVNVTTRQEVGPRLSAQRDDLSRLLKRAATPLPVALVSDNMTEVSIYKVGRLGNFMRTEVNLRPGTYVAVGVRPGFRDVRLEFRVAPEVEMEAVIVRCEEPI